jgi:branched-chain amino acid transport system substrate-binding protein
MQFKKIISALCLSIGITTAGYAQMKVGVISSATGPGSLVGIPQKNSVPLLPTKIGDISIEYIAVDDGSDPTASVTAVKKFISEQNVDAIIGPTGSPNALAVLNFIAESETPLLAPVGTIAIVLPMDAKKKWVFKTNQNDGIIAEALVEHMVKTGVKTLGFVGTGDPYGETWFKVITELATKHNIKIVASERFQRPDTSVTGQSLRIISAHPDAVLVAAPGGPAVLPQVTLFDQGYQGKIYQTHGAALPDFLKLGGKKVEGTILAASLMLVLPEMPDNNPSKKVAMEYIAAYEKVNGVKPNTFGANVYDAGLLLKRVVPEAAAKAKPGTRQFRIALRDSLEKVHELVGAQGVYNMTPEDHSGFDKRGRELITVKNGNFVLLK